MNKSLTIFNHWVLVAVTTFLFFSCGPKVIVLENHTGESKAPITIPIELSEKYLAAAQENKLVLIEIKDHEEGKEIPVQLDGSRQGLVTILPKGQPGERKFKLLEKNSPVNPTMLAEKSGNNAQPVLSESDQKILQYNYQTVQEKDVVRPGGKIIEMKFSKMSSGIYYDEYLKAHPTFPADTIVSSAVYSIPRSDYIHPLYGLNGDMLTRDWPDGGHPHHRGIFWAWPEVEYNGQRGDIYALQRVFARPTGKIEYTNGSVYTEIHAENQWIWEDAEPIVGEQVYIRAYRAVDHQRIIDLTLEFQALKENVTLATRFTDSYGGLNIRMQTPEDQEISYFTDKKDSNPRRAWADFNGIFEGNKTTSGLMILQNKSNPEYPGEWVKYPNLSWIQPTFPTPKTRYPLNTTEPLVLKYRFIVHSGGKPTDEESKANWDGYNSSDTPELK